MTFVPLQCLEELNGVLSEGVAGGSRWPNQLIHLRIEAFSCRKAARGDLPLDAAELSENSHITDSPVVVASTTALPAAACDRRLQVKRPLARPPPAIYERLPALSQVMTALYSVDGYDFDGVLLHKHFKTFASFNDCRAELNDVLDDLKPSSFDGNVSNSLSGGEDLRRDTYSLSTRFWSAVRDALMGGRGGEKGGGIVFTDADKQFVETYRLDAGDLDPIANAATAPTALLNGEQSNDGEENNSSPSPPTRSPALWSRHYFIYGKRSRLALAIVMWATHC